MNQTPLHYQVFTPFGHSFQFLPSTISVLDLKLKITKLTQIALDNIKLAHKNKILDDSVLLQNLSKENPIIFTTNRNISMDYLNNQNVEMVEQMVSNQNQSKIKDKRTQKREKTKHISEGRVKVPKQQKQAIIVDEVTQKSENIKLSEEYHEGGNEQVKMNSTHEQVKLEEISSEVALLVELFLAKGFKRPQILRAAAASGNNYDFTLNYLENGIPMNGPGMISQLSEAGICQIVTIFFKHPKMVARRRQILRKVGRWELLVKKLSNKNRYLEYCFTDQSKLIRSTLYQYEEPLADKEQGEYLRLLAQSYDQQLALILHQVLGHDLEVSKKAVILAENNLTQAIQWISEQSSNVLNQKSSLNLPSDKRLTIHQEQQLICEILYSKEFEINLCKMRCGAKYYNSLMASLQIIDASLFEILLRNKRYVEKIVRWENQRASTSQKIQI